MRSTAHSRTTAGVQPELSVSHLPAAAMLVTPQGRISMITHLALAIVGCQRNAESIAYLQNLLTRDSRDSIRIPPRITTPDGHPIQLIAGDPNSAGTLVLFKSVDLSLSADTDIRQTGFILNPYNAQRYIDKLLSSLSPDHELALVIVDLDGFKTITNRFGFSEAEKILEKVSRRFQRRLSADDHLIRLTAKQFLVVSHGRNLDARIPVLTDSLLSMVTRPYLHKRQMLHLACRSGYVLLRGDELHDADTTTADELLRRVSVALNHSRSEQIDTVRYDTQMDAAFKRKHRLGEELRQAVQLDQLRLHYQPLMHAKDEKIVGFEALIRWQHPLHGTIPPATFIPLAEELGLMASIGEWVIKRATLDAIHWPDDVKVSINVSAQQFSHGDIVQTVNNALNKAKLDPERMELEITESVLLDNTDRISQVLNNLKAMGIRISMDDFGSGYSSLSYLRSFPFDKVKIDQSFVRGQQNAEHNQTIRRAIISLGRNLGISTLAEGVETETQLNSLLAEGCLYVQGYFFSKPVPFNETFVLLRQYNKLTADSRPAPVPETIEEAGQSVEPGLNSDLFRIIFVSRCLLSADPVMRSQALENIRLAGQRHNSARQISSALICSDHLFAQVLEGPVEDIEPLFERILTDTRHSDISVVEAAHVPNREFPDWSMATVEQNADNRYLFDSLKDEAGPGRQPGGQAVLQAIRDLVRLEVQRVPLSA